MPEEDVEAEDAAWVAAMALTPEENVNLTDTVAATDRKYRFSSYVDLKKNIGNLDLCVCFNTAHVCMILAKTNVVSVV